MANETAKATQSINYRRWKTSCATCVVPMCWIPYMQQILLSVFPICAHITPLFGSTVFLITDTEDDVLINVEILLSIKLI